MSVGRSGNFDLPTFLHCPVFRDNLAENIAMFGNNALPIAQSKILTFIKPSADFGVIPEQWIDPSEIVPGQQITVIAIAPVFKTPATAIGLALIVEFAVAGMRINHRAVMGIEEMFDDKFFGLGEKLIDRSECCLEIGIQRRACGIILNLHH